MAKEKHRERLQELFSEIEKLSVQPITDHVAIRRELEALRQRVANLETEMAECDDSPSGRESLSTTSAERVQARPVSFRLYEKKKVGFVFADNRIEPVQGPVPEVDAEKVLRAALTETGKPIGEVMVEGTESRPWSPQDATLADAVAQQASIQIQNLRLLAAAERSRSEAVEATRRYTHESWKQFLDAIHQSERIGYVYDQNGVEPFQDPNPVATDFQETVNVLDEQVGKLFVEADRPLSESEKAMVSAVARQLGQQVENLRLLADASRARAEAEEATRRLTRDSWKKFASKKMDSPLGFIYDSNRVEELNEEPDNIIYSKPLTVRGETIGQLAVAGWDEIPAEAENLIAAIARQTSIHLETVRLNEELQKRAAELQELDRLKSSFLANMSHELRTPLNSILGFSDVMLEGIDGPLTDYMNNDLRLIQKNGQHLLHLINDVLDMAKIESGRMSLHLEKFCVNTVLEEILSITSTFASEKNLALYIEEDSDKEVEIIADETRLRQVMINLINNAIKFTERGKVSLRVDRLDSSRIKILVKDTGIGIPTEHLENVFQEFAQVDSSTTRKVGGTGLGLPISRRLVEMHGGSMWAESTGVNGEGSVFHVEMLCEARVTEIVEKVMK